MTERGATWYTLCVMPSRSLFSHYTSYFWAMASLVPLPLCLIILPSIGLSSLASFALGLVLTGCVLAMNALVEHRVWIMHEEWHHVFSRPDASFRLAVVAGALLLIVESTVLVLLLVSPGADEAILSLVLGRQCSAPHGVFIELCAILTN